MSSSSPNLSSYVILKEYTRYQTTKYEGKGTSKIQVFKIFSEFEKTWKYRLSYSKDPVFHLFHELGKKKVNIAQERPLFQNPNFKSVDELGNLYPNLSWNNETMIRNSHKKRMATF